MKIHILSDLHYESVVARSQREAYGFHDAILPVEGADVMVLAGDICANADELFEALKLINYPILIILGNHDYYGKIYQDSYWPDVVRAVRRKGVDIHLLDKGVKTIGGYRFVGCTWWPALDWLATPQTINVQHLRDVVEMGITDFRVIQTRATNGKRRRVYVDDMIRWHADDHKWLKGEISKCTEKTVIITHYLPSVKAVDSEYAGSALNPYFANKFLDENEIVAPLWICGHTHKSVDVVVENTRVVANPRGYGNEVNDFQWNYAVTL